MLATPLTAGAFAPFGHVVAALHSPPRSGNQGRAQVWDDLAPLTTTRPEARPSVSLFRTVAWGEPSLCVRLLERHPHSTQLFVPMTALRYLVVVARPADAPGEISAFIARGDQAIAYAPGTWHHPLVALDRQTV